MPCPCGICGLGLVFGPALWKGAKELEPRTAALLALAVPLCALAAAAALAPDFVSGAFGGICECTQTKTAAMGAGAMYLCGVKSLADGALVDKKAEKVA